MCIYWLSNFFFFNDTATTEIYTLSLHDALPILGSCGRSFRTRSATCPDWLTLRACGRSEEHTSELQSLTNLVCRLLLEKKNTQRPWNAQSIQWFCRQRRWGCWRECTHIGTRKEL